MLRNPLTKVYLQFLSYALNMMNEFNTIHQSETPQAHNLPKQTAHLVRDIASNFMHTQYVRSTAPSNIDPHLTSQYVPLNQVYLGKI